MIPFVFVLTALAIIYIIGCFLVEMEFFGWATVVLIATVVGVQLLNVFDIFTYVAHNILASTLYAMGYVAIGVAWSFIKWFSFLMKYRDKFRELKQKFLDLNKLPSNSTSPDDREIPYAISNSFDRYCSTHISAAVKARGESRRPGDLADSKSLEEQTSYNAIRNQLWISFLDESKTSNNQNIPTTLKESFEAFLREQHSYGEYGSLKFGQKPTAATNKAKITAWMAFWPCSVISTFLNDPIRRLFRFLFNSLKALYQKMADAVFADDPELK